MDEWKSPILETKYKMSNDEIKTRLKSNPIRLYFEFLNLSIICYFCIAFLSKNCFNKPNINKNYL